MYTINTYIDYDYSLCTCNMTYFCTLLITLFGVSLIFLMRFLASSFMKANNFWACWLVGWNTAAVLLMLGPPLAWLYQSWVLWYGMCMGKERMKQETLQWVLLLKWLLIFGSHTCTLYLKLLLFACTNFSVFEILGFWRY